MELRAAEARERGTQASGTSTSGCRTGASRQHLQAGRHRRRGQRGSSSTRASTWSRSGSRSRSRSRTATRPFAAPARSRSSWPRTCICRRRGIRCGKLRELIITRRLEAALPKARILEIYLNVIEWGDGIWGAEAASRTLLRRVGVESQPSAGGAAGRRDHQPDSLQPGAPTGRLLRRQQIILSRMGGVEPPPQPATGNADPVPGTAPGRRPSRWPRRPKPSAPPEPARTA